MLRCLFTTTNRSADLEIRMHGTIDSDENLPYYGGIVKRRRLPIFKQQKTALSSSTSSNSISMPPTLWLLW
jgi:hypothetical protein